MINPKKFYIGFLTAISIVGLMIIVPQIKNGDTLIEYESRIDVNKVLRLFLEEAEIREDEELKYVLNNFDNIKAPVEDDTLRLKYIVDGESYLIQNNKEIENTYLNELNNMEKTIKIYQKLTSKSEDRYVLIEYLLELISNKKEQIAIYDETLKSNLKQEIEDDKDIEENTGDIKKQENENDQEQDNNDMEDLSHGLGW